MTAYNLLRSSTLTIDVAERRAARRKVIEKARKPERDCYKAMMRRRRQLQTSDYLV